MTVILILFFMFLTACASEVSPAGEQVTVAPAKTIVIPAPQQEPAPAPVQEAGWVESLREQITLLDEQMPGSLGVYIKNMADDHSLSYNAENDLYFASTTKIPVAIAILQRVNAGELSLDQKVALKETDFVDGNGDVKWQKPGTTYTIAILLEKMIRESDNCSTDMLIRLMGQEELNQQVRERMIAGGINPITTLLQVRYDAFSEIHPGALKLTNRDIMNINSTASRQERMNRLLRLMAVEDSELKVHSLEEAFDRYYRRGYNSGRLESMGLLLERFYNGELLSPEHTEYLMGVMQNITTGDRRIKAGLPSGVLFAQKTGTQIETAANAGIIFPANNPEGQPIIVVVNARNFGQLSHAEEAMKKIGEMIGESLLVK
ncbi:MAG: serine hydrolase [Bacteroidales bacterium]